MDSKTKKTHKDVVVINGRRYSARSGKPLDSSPSVDGIRTGKHHVAATISSQIHQAAHRSSPAAAHAKALHKKSAAHPSHRPNHPIHVEHAAHHQHRSTGTKTELQGLFDKLMKGVGGNPDREKRAKVIQRSHHISKFGGRLGSESQIFEADAVPLRQPAPVEHIVDLDVHQTIDIQPSPGFEAPILMPSSGHLQPKPVKQSAAHHGHSRSHKKVKKPRKPLSHKKKLTSSAAAVLSILLLASYFAYLKVPDLTVRVAASRAGIEAQIPGYHPDGFGFDGPVETGPGSVIISFRSTTGDNRAYKVAQRASDWDSASLQENYVSRASENFQTINDKGLTIYIWNGSNASWVDKGIWYSVEGESLLSTEQLLKIAASI